jgi:hypothetical protein
VLEVQQFREWLPGLSPQLELGSVVACGHVVMARDHLVVAHGHVVVAVCCIVVIGLPGTGFEEEGMRTCLQVETRLCKLMMMLVSVVE